MEADWEFEIGGDAPVIEAYWPGFVNLRECPTRASDLAEVEMLPELAPTLLLLNAAESPVWTCKADVFVPGQIDPDELSGTAEESRFALACYIDMLMRSDQIWQSPSNAEKDCRKLCSQLRKLPLRCCRVDMVIRRAHVGDAQGLGATVYFTACGATETDVRKNLAECLRGFAKTLVPGLEISAIPSRAKP
jgi:hypothetical protein